MKRLLIIPAILFCLSLQAEERYQDLIRRTENLAPYDALYNMLAYQRLHPTEAPLYYRMGDIAYQLLPEKDPLHNYDERAELLYKAKLFYGNCLYFLGGKMPRNESFPTITPAGKRVEYVDVEAYLRAHLDTVKRWKAETDTLHDRFYRMVDSYEQCRTLFLNFLETYPSEKLAHLCFTPADKQTLDNLQRLSSKFDAQQQAFIEALSASPVPHYEPAFRFVHISTYRLDGCTSTDFLQNDIALWDYSTWVTTFLSDQQHTYIPLMRELVEEYTQHASAIDRYRVGLPVSVTPDPILLHRLDRIDYHSPIATFLQLHQLVSQTILQAQDSLTTDETITDEALATRITAVLEARQRQAETEDLLQRLKKEVTAETATKYALFLRDTRLGTPEKMIAEAEEAYATQQLLTIAIDEQLQQYANAHHDQFDEVEIKDEE